MELRIARDPRLVDHNERIPMFRIRDGPLRLNPTLSTSICYRTRIMSEIEARSLERDAPSAFQVELAPCFRKEPHFTAATTFPFPFRFPCSQMLSLLLPTSASQPNFLP